jgi:hypothetical protein
MYGKAVDGMKAAGANMQFVSEHLAATYGMNQHDTFNLQTGLIKRDESEK